MAGDTLKAVPKKEETHMLIVGPSWIVGMFPASKLNAAEAELSARLGRPVKLDVVARVGEGIDWMRKKLQKTLDEHPQGYYDSVIFFPGRNDIMKKRTADITQSISDTVRLLRDVPHVFVFNIQYSDKRLLREHTYKVDKINESLQRQFGGDNRVSLLDLHSYTKQHGLGYPLHPSVRGYAGLRDWSIGAMALQLARAEPPSTRPKPLTL